MGSKSSCVVGRVQYDPRVQMGKLRPRVIETVTELGLEVSVKGSFCYQWFLIFCGVMEPSEN